ncbi:MAG: cytoplasmic protein [Candidatus Reconcilbacillus cellulovorans]|uniref:Cytoplasmic protein n=1 Tax=Candidatus Reconcilbacillus cellulovorans TaxID=1906605 RepID=A0A2A6DZI0_9BACL|nr:MAG: cytoplasmic protein [Candidatus Reconcilbacillus cellulovorans]
MTHDERIVKRLRRAEGQIRGVLRMIEQGRPCRDVVAQLCAVRNAVDRAIAHIVAVNLEQCVRSEQERGQSSETAVRQAIELLVKSR